MRTVLVVFCVLCVAAITQAQDFEVLVLQGNISNAEYAVLEGFNKIGTYTFNYSKTSDRALPGINKANILWIGQGEICENAYFFNAETEKTIKDFVEGGGIVISIGQDSDGGRPCEAGWLPVPMGGAERGGTEVFEITNAPEVDDLFTTPNKIATIHSDDAWTQPDPAVILLSTINNGQDVGIGLLSHGKGYYIITSIENESAGDVSINTPIMENLLLYAANLIVTAPVESAGKLATVWGTLKAH